MFAKALAILLVVPFVLQLAFADETCSRSYTVRAGDICDSISAANNASTYQVAVVNDGIIDESCDNLQEGQSICLGWVGSDCSNTYVVDMGDTCDDVAYNFGINTTILYANNPQLDGACDNLYIGEVVCVASTVVVPPAPASGTIPGTVIPATATPADVTYCD